MRGLFILLLLCLKILIFAVVSRASPNSSDPEQGSENGPLALTLKHQTAIVAAPDGTVYFVETASGKILWSFSSGQSIYSSYQQIPNDEGEKLNATANGENFYIDCGEDWELYLHRDGLKKVKLPVNVEEFVNRTPFVSSGGVMLGSKKTAVYVVDAATGKVVRSFRSENLPAVGERGADEISSLTRTDIEEWLPSRPVDTDAVEKPLYVTRTDYALKYTSLKTGKVLWYLMFADIEASFQCDGIENFLGGFSHNNNPPVHCEPRPVVYRIHDRRSLEPLFMAKRVRDAISGGGILSLPAPDQNDIESSPPLPFPDQHAVIPVHKLIAPHLNNGKEIVEADPLLGRDKFVTSSVPGSGATHVDKYVETDTPRPSLFWPSMLYSALVSIAMAIFFYVRVIVKRQGKLNMADELKVQNLTHKKRKGRKSVLKKPSSIVGKSHEDIAQPQSVVLEGTTNDTFTTDRFFSLVSSDNNGSCTDGRKIGKLIVTNTEIAKGSNGTVVLEGNFDGRAVAVKRLVLTHHSIALKEIQNLIASDQHPNIVRWHGVEYDQDFIYICLERCTCNLHELIVACTSQIEIIAKDEGGDSSRINNRNMQLLQIFRSNKGELKLWKANGYPSPWLLKLMRDTVCGLAHLHELGIIHRDLKPQNVLVIKDRSIAAKISDMGISKHLVGDNSSLTKHTTGFGSSGWQAPEQLLQQRQSRAVDLFSLGCILFFCITGGRHPFGENLERDINIVNGRKDLFLIDNIPEATDLVSQLLDPNPDLRPKAIEVMNHPLFWNPEMRLSFLRDVSDRIELEDREDASELLEALESVGEVVLGGKWDEKMDNTLLNDIGRYRRYRFDSMRDLLRVIRNKLNHYRELPKDVQALLGSIPTGFDNYFSSRFPKLVIEVYHVVVTYCSEEDVFNNYLKGSSRLHVT